MSVWEEVFGKKTLNFAHRGFTASAPENSLAAFQAAVELGVDGIELDVRTCKSGEVVVFHDSKLERLTNGEGYVKNKTLAELKRLSIHNHGCDTDERIPILEEVIELVRDKALLNIEIKANGLTAKHNIETKVVRILQRFGIGYKTIISSFHPLVMRRIRRVNEEILNGFLIDKNFSFRNYEIFFTKIAGAKAIHMEGSLVTQELTAKIYERGYYLLVWTVNDPKLMKRLIELKVHGIITDRPDLLEKIKNESNL